MQGPIEGGPPVGLPDFGGPPPRRLSGFGGYVCQSVLSFFLFFFHYGPMFQLLSC